MRASGVRREVVVLQSVKPPTATTNPYVVQLVGAMPADIRVHWFSWRRALLGRYDVLHVHWPEVMIRRVGRPARWLARARFASLLLRLAATRTPVVRTAHNLTAHEGLDPVERVLVGALDRLTRQWVRLNRHTPTPGPATTILHGDYRGWYGGDDAEPGRGRLLFVGLIRAYKRVPQLIASFGQLDDADDGPLSLHVVGAPATDALRDEVLEVAAPDSRVTVRLGHASDEEVAAEIRAAELVVLPHREMHNSGALLLALSLARPALVPSTAVTEELAREVGVGWVVTYDGDLEAAALRRALAVVRDTGRTPEPDLSRRRWPALAAQHAAVYRQAILRSG